MPPSLNQTTDTGPSTRRRPADAGSRRRDEKPAGSIVDNLVSMTTATRLRALLQSAGLAGGSIAGGLLAYVFFALVTRALGAEAAAPVSVLWVWWGFAAAALTFPLQHWITRMITAHGGELVLRVMLGRIAGAVAVPALVAGLLAWLVRDPLFGRDGVGFPLLVVAVTLGSGLLGVVRGTLTARRRFAAVGLSLMLENVIRCVAAATLFALDVDSPLAYGGCLVGGYLASVVWLSALRFGRDGTPPEPGSTLGLVRGVALGQLLAQIALTGGPILLALAGGAPAEVTALFAGLALFRAPYTFAVGLVAPLTGWLTTLVVQEREDTLRRFRVGVLGVTAVLGLLAALLGGWIGPPLMELVFGSGIRLDADLTAVLAVGTVFAMANLVHTLLVVARGRSGGLVRGWLLGSVPGVVLFALSGLPVVERTSWMFLVVEGGVFAWLFVEDLLASRRPGAVVA
jgi:O-antigen/teichoic acid export membrane protein